MKIVLQKFIADSGYCSRRKAEELIRLGRVKVNGQPAELGMRVSAEDEVKIDGKRVGLAERKVYIKLNKPAGYASTSARLKGERNVFDLVKIKERLFIVGRLDKNSRGLTLLTNDGELAQQLAHPRFEHEKKYTVTISCNKKTIPRQGIEMIKGNFLGGIDIGEGDGVVKAKAVKYLGASQSQSQEDRKHEKANGKKIMDPRFRGNDTPYAYRFEVILTYGKKRQIRRMFKALGCEVTDLLRTEIAGLRLGSLKEGGWAPLSSGETKKLQDQVNRG